MPLLGDRVVTARKRARFVVALVLAFAGTSRAQYVIGEEAGILGSEQGFFRSPITGTVVPSATFDLVAGATTPNDLSDSLVVNSTSMTLVLACDAQGISGTAWTCRDANGAVTLSEAGTGASPTTTINTPFHALDSAERGVSYTSGGKTHAAATSTVGQITTQDFAFEAVYRQTTSGAAGVVFAKRSGTNAGFSLNRSTTNFYTTTVTDGVDTVTTGGVGLTSGSYAHVMFFADRNGGANGLRSYTNGTSFSTTNIDLVDSLSGSDVFTVGGLSGAASGAGASPLVSFRIWVCPASTPNCFASSSNDAEARQRAATAFGVAPIIAAGTAAPTALTRATLAHTDVVDGSVRHLYQLMNGAPRVARRTYSGGTALAGYMSEPAVSNIALQSQTLGTTWTAITAGDNVLAEQFMGADLTQTGDDVDGNNTLAEHGLRQAITLTAATHSFSAWARAGSQTFVALRNNTVASGAAWFDLTACAACTIGEDCAAAVKTTQAGVIQARAQRWPVDSTGDGVADVNLCRISISYTGTAVNHDHDLLCAPSDNVTSYTDADAAADCGFWGVRVEAFPVMTSYLATTTAAVARNADDVRFDGASHYTGSPSTMDVHVLCPSFDVASSSSFASIGTGTANFARLGIDATNDRALADGTVTTAQWSIVAASGDVSDGVAHKLRQTMATDSVEAFYDGVSVGTDTLATLPTVASSFLYFGTTGSTAAASGCLISRARLWSSLVTPAVVP